MSDPRVRPPWRVRVRLSWLVVRHGPYSREFVVACREEWWRKRLKMRALEDAAAGGAS